MHRGHRHRAAHDGRDQRGQRNRAAHVIHEREFVEQRVEKRQRLDRLGTRRLFRNRGHRRRVEQQQLRLRIIPRLRQDCTVGPKRRRRDDTGQPREAPLTVARENDRRHLGCRVGRDILLRAAVPFDPVGGAREAVNQRRLADACEPRNLGRATVRRGHVIHHRAHKPFAADVERRVGLDQRAFGLGRDVVKLARFQRDCA